MTSRFLKNHLGTVYLVGAGPGDVGLLTLRGKKLLESAEVVFYDHLVNPEILQFCKNAKQHYVGKVGHEEHISQTKIEAALVKAAKKYHIIVRLKGGDPFIFGRGGEEAEFLAERGIPFEIVPGVSSATAVPAYAGIPLTHRQLSSSVTFVTGHENPLKATDHHNPLALNWSALAGEKTLVFLMGVKTLRDNFSKLIEHGMSSDTPAAVIEWGTYPRQRTIVGNLSTLPELATQAEIQPPSITVVGEVVKLRDQLHWFESKPLFGKKILVTRTREQAGEMTRQLRELGAQPLEFPTLEIQAPKSWSAFDKALKEISKYDWILFTSVHAVESFFNRLKFLKKDLRSLGAAKIAAVGPYTVRRLTDLGLRVAFQPKEFTSDALAAGLKTKAIKGKRILFPRAEEARENIVKILRSRGALLNIVTAYRARAPRYPKKQLQEIFKAPPDLLTFASASMVKNFVKILKPISYWPTVKKIPCIVIGPVTRQAAIQEGLRVVGMPRSYTIEGLIEEVVSYLSKKLATTSSSLR